MARVVKNRIPDAKRFPTKGNLPFGSPGSVERPGMGIYREQDLKDSTRVKGRFPPRTVGKELTKEEIRAKSGPVTRWTKARIEAENKKRKTRSRGKEGQGSKSDASSTPGENKPKLGEAKPKRGRGGGRGGGGHVDLRPIGVQEGLGAKGSSRYGIRPKLKL